MNKNRIYKNVAAFEHTNNDRQTNLYEVAKNK